MKRTELIFPRPQELEATEPAELRGIERDEVRLLVSTPERHLHASFQEIPHFLQPGDLLVVNQSQTLPASLPAAGKDGPFRLNLSTSFGKGLWLAEPRWSFETPGPVPLAPGDTVQSGELTVHFLSPYPGLPRLWFVRIDGNELEVMARFGKPIRYGYARKTYPLSAYQTLFGAVPGSAEMPSAARPFTPRALESLRARGVGIATLTLHTGVSSLEVESDVVEAQPLYPEPYWVPPATARAVNAARKAGRRVIAVGTTVVRALESAWDGRGVRPSSGHTRLYVHPGRGVHAVDGLLTGFHDPATSHLAMLYSLASPERIRSAYEEAIRERYLWHEFGDSHLILAERSHCRAIGFQQGIVQLAR